MTIKIPKHVEPELVPLSSLPFGKWYTDANNFYRYSLTEVEGVEVITKLYEGRVSQLNYGDDRDTRVRNPEFGKSYEPKLLLKIPPGEWWKCNSGHAYCWCDFGRSSGYIISRINNCSGNISHKFHNGMPDIEVIERLTKGPLEVCFE